MLRSGGKREFPLLRNPLAWPGWLGLGHRLGQSHVGVCRVPTTGVGRNKGPCHHPDTGHNQRTEWPPGRHCSMCPGACPTGSLCKRGVPWWQVAQALEPPRKQAAGGLPPLPRQRQRIAWRCVLCPQMSLIITQSHWAKDGSVPGGCPQAARSRGAKYEQIVHREPARSGGKEGPRLSYTSRGSAPWIPEWLQSAALGHVEARGRGREKKKTEKDRELRTRKYTKIDLSPVPGPGWAAWSWPAGCTLPSPQSG